MSLAQYIVPNGQVSLSQSSFLVTKMVDICHQNGGIKYASLLFRQVLEPNNFLCNAMIRSYSHDKCMFAQSVYISKQMYVCTISIYKQMLKRPNS